MPSRMGIGPVSRNAVDAAIRLAYRQRRPVMLVASRGQIECEQLGGGYVERWTTEAFTRYVRDRDPARLIMLCRDHGGPWQHPDEVASGLVESQVLARSLASLRTDIQCGMDLLHLDTSREGSEEADFDCALTRLVGLYRECENDARAQGRRVCFEVGLERQGANVDDPAAFRSKVERILDALTGASLERPTFVVAQTGTQVVATENRGELCTRPDAVTAALRGMAAVCREHEVALKAHNVDYLPGDAVVALFRCGIDAINVAPEFGVIETRAFLMLLDRLGLPGARDEFLHLGYESRAWRKWVDDNATDLERCIVAGHYVFATPQFLDIKCRAERACRAYGTAVDDVLGQALDEGMERYATLAWGPA